MKIGKPIVRISIIVIICIICAVILEYLYNDARKIPEEKRISTELTLDNITSDGFTEKNGKLYAAKKNATITITEDFTKILRIKTSFSDYSQVVVEVNGKEKVADSPSGIREGFEISNEYFSYRINKRNAKITIKTKADNVNLDIIEIDNTYVFNYYLFAYVLLFEFLIGVLLYIVIKKKENVEKLFVVCASILIIATSISLTETAYNTWDEQIHYSRIAGIDVDLAESYDFDLGNLTIAPNYDIETMDDVISDANNEKEEHDAYFHSDIKKQKTITYVYNRLAYLPSIAVVVISRFVGLDYPVVFILGRLINGAIYIVLAYFAIKKLRSGKVLLSVVALLPINIFQASTYNVDWWVTGFTMLGSAYLLEALQTPEKKLTKNEYAVIMVAFFLGCGPKAIYFPIVLCALLIGKDKFWSEKQYRWNVVCIIAATLLIVSSFMLSFLLSGQGGGDARGGADVNAAMQVAYILRHPIRYTKILLAFLLQYLSPNNISGTIVSLGYICQRGSDYGPLIYALLILTAVTDGEIESYRYANTKSRIVVWFMCFVIACLISTALYVSFTPVGLDTINGVQGRYLCPILFIVFAMLRSTSIENNMPRHIYNVIMLGIPAIITMQILGENIVSGYF